MGGYCNGERASFFKLTWLWVGHIQQVSSLSLAGKEEVSSLSPASHRECTVCAQPSQIWRLQDSVSPHSDWTVNLDRGKVRGEVTALVDAPGSFPTDMSRIESQQLCFWCCKRPCDHGLITASTCLLLPNTEITLEILWNRGHVAF